MTFTYDPDEDDFDEPDELTDEQIAALFDREHTAVEALLLAGLARPATRAPQPLDVDRDVHTLPAIDDYNPSEVRMTNLQRAHLRIRTHRRILWAFTVATVVLVAFGGWAAVHSSPYLVAVCAVAAALLIEGAARSGRTVREARLRIRYELRMSGLGPCCAPFQYSATVHGVDCLDRP
ncbi:hypothetical protein ACFRH6_14390 [Streptomyces sp. NPDC056749]|uniref:hypothetical protein n=1 Tax=Streptomyces sp. NPDC056749 TaxID=3345936 RepID=UPI0036D1874D